METFSSTFVGLFVIFFLGRACHAMPRPLPGLCQIDAAQQQHEFFVAEDDFALFTRGFRPAKTPFPEPLVTPSEMQLMRPQRRVLCE